MGMRYAATFAPTMKLRMRDKATGESLCMLVGARSEAAPTVEITFPKVCVFVWV